MRIGTQLNLEPVSQLLYARCERNFPDIRFHIEGGEGEVMFGRQGGEEFLLDGAFGHEQIDQHWPLLPHPMSPCYALFEDCRIPRQIDVDNGVCCLQVEPGRACVGREEYAACRVTLKLVHQLLPLALWDGSVQPDAIELQSLDLPFDQCEHSRPLGEEHNLALLFRGQLLQ